MPRHQFLTNQDPALKLLFLGLFFFFALRGGSAKSAQTSTLLVQSKIIIFFIDTS
jgi:hypothetical protein